MPLDAGEDKSLVQEIFYLDVSAFSENGKMMGEFLNAPPDWLKGVGDAE